MIYNNNGLAYYLISLSIEEYIRYKAYFFWLENSNSTPDQNYFRVIDYLNIAKQKCPFSGGCRSHDCLTTLLDTVNLCTKETIISGKKSTIKRLAPTFPSARVDSLYLQVPRFTNHFYSEFIPKIKTSSPQTCYAPNFQLDMHPIMNVFEYFLSGLSCPATPQS
jgi:hypothetical protein